MLSRIYWAYAAIFGRPLFLKLNKFLFNISLRGLGILNYRDDYSSGEYGCLRRYLRDRREPVIIDVGANIGRYSESVRELCPTASVHALEPHPLTFKKLESISGKYRLEVYNLALSERPGVLELYDYCNSDGSQHASLYNDVIEVLHSGKSVSHKVSVSTLDEFLELRDIQEVDLLKIDTEGNEYKVLVGGLNYLTGRKIKAIHLEFNEMNVMSGARFLDFWNLLNDYNLYRMLPGGSLLPIRAYSPLNCEIYAYQNIFAILKSE